MVRTQLSSVLSLLIVQKLEFFQQFGFRVPVLSILKGINSVKSTIRDNRFSQIESILQTGRGEGMYTQEKYMSEYINSRGRLTPPEICFKPSSEIANSRLYSSPIVDQNGEIKNKEKISYVPIKNEITSGHNEFGHYIISGTSSVEDVISELEKK